MEYKFLMKPSEIAEAEAQLPIEQRVPWPPDSMIMYAYAGDKIIGRMALMSIKVIEGTWADPHAGATLAFRMMKQMETVIQYLGNTHVFAMASDNTPKIGEYLERVNFTRFPVTLYNKELTK